MCTYLNTEGYTLQKDGILVDPNGAPVCNLVTGEQFVKPALDLEALAREAGMVAQKSQGFFSSFFGNYSGIVGYKMTQDIKFILIMLIVAVVAIIFSVFAIRRNKVKMELYRESLDSRHFIAYNSANKSMEDNNTLLDLLEQQNLAVIADMSTLERNIEEAKARISELRKSLPNQAAYRKPYNNRKPYNKYPKRK